jgi:hypothetical protein
MLKLKEKVYMEAEYWKEKEDESQGNLDIYTDQAAA